MAERGVAERGEVDGTAGSTAIDLATAFVEAGQLQNLGRFVEADAVFAVALERAAAAGRDDDVAALAMPRASLRFWNLADAAGALAVLDEAEAAVTAPAALDTLAAQRSVVLLFGGQTRPALELARGVRARGHAAPGLLAAAMEAVALGLLGDTEALAELPDATGLAEGVFPLVPMQRFAEASLHLATGMARAVNGLDAADPDGGAAPTAAARTGAAMREACAGTAELVSAIRLVWAGRVATAEGVLRGAVAHLRRSDRVRNLSQALAHLAFVRALQGDAVGAAAAAEDAEEARHPANRVDELARGRAHAWAAAAAGELSAARDGLAATAGRVDELGQPALAAQAWHDVARLGAPGLAARPLRRLAAAAPPGSLVPTLAAHVDALAGGDAPGVAEAARAARGRGHRLLAAEAAAQAAALYARDGRAEADRWRTAAHHLSAACEGARTPALLGLVDLDLTTREREIAGLVARGLSNREVADRLHLSVRTVGNHLQSAYAKLGVHRREELTHLLPFG